VARTVAAQHELSRKVAAWTEAGSTDQPLTPDERATLAAVEHAVLTAAKRGDPRPCVPWGGFNPARRLAIGLRKRADLEDAGATSGAVIDAYSTHHARHLGPQALA
jgi:hypothetical protein